MRMPATLRILRRVALMATAAMTCITLPASGAGRATLNIVIVLDERGRITYISPAVDAVFGKPAERLVCTSFSDYVDHEGVTQGLALYEELLAHPDLPVASELKVLDDGVERWVEATWTNQLHEPAVQGLVGNMRDITDRRRANAFGADETRAFELILSGAPVPETLTTLVRALEAYIPDGVGSIRLLDPEHQTLECVADCVTTR